MKKHLFGVAHKDEQELKYAQQELQHYSLGNIALELPEDYKTQEKYGVHNFYFGDLLNHFRKRKKRIILLEKPTLCNQGQALSVAKAVRQGEIKKEALEMQLQHLRSKIGYTPLDILYPQLVIGASYEHALKILHEASTLEQVLELWHQSNAKRERYMLQKIRKTAPDSIIIGDGHAQRLQPQLPQYRYVKLY